MRKTSPLLSKGSLAKRLNLLELIDPRLDRVQGIWFFDDGSLRSPVEFEARLQIPVAPPESYRLGMTIERLQGDEMFGLGIVIGVAKRCFLLVALSRLPWASTTWTASQLTKMIRQS